MTNELHPPRQARRRGLPDQWNDAVAGLIKATNRIGKLAEDDRFEDYRERFGGKNGSDVLRALETITEVSERLVIERTS